VSRTCWVDARTRPSKAPAVASAGAPARPAAPKARKKHSPLPLHDALNRALEIGEAHPFIRACMDAQIAPGVRELARWREGRGAALHAAWERWPRSKNLPRLAEDRRARGAA
jgi:hypothetical protein